MLKVHHLNDSRSQKTLWLLEELGLPYEIVFYQRDPKTFRAPASLKALHPAAKSPVLEDDGQILIESGAIVEYIISKHGDGGLAPPPGSEAYARYLQWLYYAVSSGMDPILLKVRMRSWGLIGTPIDTSADTDLAAVLTYLNGELDSRAFLLGAEFSAADIQISFIAEIGKTLGTLVPYPHVESWLRRLHARPAFLRSLDRGGPYRLAS
jgi:glutathione S-transferase